MSEPTSSKDTLLNELESIVDLLDEYQPAKKIADTSSSLAASTDQQAAALEPPLLSEVIPEQLIAPPALDKSLPNPEPPLLNIESIFDDIDLSINANMEPPSPGRQSNFQNNRYLVIQELVDEWVPLIEAKLRAKLELLSEETINELAKKHLPL